MLGQSGITSETREHIVAVAHELGYVKDSRAQSLKTTSTHTVAMLVRSARLSFYGELMSLLQEQIELSGFRVVVATQSAGQSTTLALEQVLGLRPDALVIASGRIPEFEIERHARSLPIVLAGPRSRSRNFGSVSDDGSGAEELAQLVAKTGHRTVGLLIPLAGLSSTIGSRSDRMRAALLQHGVTIRSIRLREDDTPDPDDLAAALDTITAIMCPTDPSMVATWEQLQDWSIDVPGRISLTGYDGVGQLASPVLGLTTWRQPLELIARATAAQVLGRLHHREATPRQEAFTGRMIRGRTLSKPPESAAG